MLVLCNSMPLASQELPQPYSQSELEDLVKKLEYSLFYVDAYAHRPRYMDPQTVPRHNGAAVMVLHPETGKTANLLLLEANPLETVEAWDQIRWVVLGGRVISRETLSAESLPR